MKRTYGCFGFLMGLLLAGTMTAGAGNRTWDGTGANNNWSTPANWDGDATAPSAGDALFFGGSTRLTNNNDYAASTSFAGLTFNSGAGAFVITGAVITLGGNVTNSSASLQTLNLPMVLGATRTFNTASSGSLTVGGVLSGAGGLTKSGAGLLVLSGSNTYSGTTTFSAGTLIFGSRSALGPGAITFGGGAMQAGSDFSGANAVTSAVTLSENSTISGTNSITFTGPWTLTASRTLTNSLDSGKVLELSGNLYLTESSTTPRTLTFDGLGTTTVSGAIANYNGVTTSNSSIKIAGGTVIFTGTNTYTGTTTISADGTLQIYSTNNLGPGALVFAAGSGGGTATLALRSDGSTTFVRDATPNGVSFDSITAYNVDRATAGGPLNGTITWGTLGSNYVYNNDRGQLLVTGANGYGLTMNPNLSWAGANQDDKPNIVNNAPGLLTIQGTITCAASSGGKTTEFAGTGDILVNGQITAGSTSYRILKTGAGTVTLAGAIASTDYGFTVNGGTLRLSGSATVPTNAPVVVTMGTFDLNNINSTNTTLTMGGGAAGTASTLATGAGTLTLGGTVTYKGSTANDNGATISGKIDLGGATRTFSISNSTAVANDLTISANISGTGGGLTKLGTGTMALSGTNSYDGVTTISVGVLRLDSANALPGGIGSSGGTNNLYINGGVLGLGYGDCTRGIGTGATQVRMDGGGGFAAYGADRVVNLGGSSALQTWGSGSFVPVGKILVLGAADATAKLDFQNPINLNAKTNTVQVDDNPATAADYAVLSGVVTNGALVKTGSGTLVLAASTNRFSPYLTVSNGTLVVNGVTTSTVTTVAGGALIVNGPLNGAITVNSGATIGGTGTVASSSLTLNSGAKLRVTIQSAGGATDALQVSGTLNVANVTLEIVNPEKLTAGTSYTVLNGAHTGTFAGSNLPSDWMIDYQPTVIKVKTSRLLGTLLKIQ